MHPPLLALIGTTLPLLTLASHNHNQNNNNHNSHAKSPLILHSRSTLHLLPRALFPRGNSCSQPSSHACPTADGTPSSTFCCPTSTECIALANFTSVICCNVDEFCDEIHPIPCSSSSSSDDSEKQQKCGTDNCCPIGFECQGDNKCLMTTENLPPKYKDHAKSQQKTAETNRQLCEKLLDVTCPAFPAKAIVVGFFPGLLVGAAILFAYTKTVEMKTRRRSIKSFAGFGGFGGAGAGGGGASGGGGGGSGGNRRSSAFDHNNGPVEKRDTVAARGGSGADGTNSDIYTPQPSYLSSPQNLSPNLGPTIAPARDRSRTRLGRDGAHSAMDSITSLSSSGLSGSRNEGVYSDTTVEIGARGGVGGGGGGGMATTHHAYTTHSREPSDPFRDRTLTARPYRDDFDDDVEVILMPSPGRTTDTGRGGERGGGINPLRVDKKNIGSPTPKAF